MARLPTLDDLGERQAPRPTPAVAVGRTDAVAASVQELGRTMESISNEVTKARRAADLSAAMGSATLELGEKELEFQRDQDFATAGARFKSVSTEIGTRHSKGIADPVARAIFDREYLQLSTAKQLSVATSRARQESDFHNANLASNMETFALAASNAKTEIERRTVLDAAKMSIGEMRAQGWITDVRAVELEKGFRQRMDWATGLREIEEAPAVAMEKFKDPAYLSNLDPVTRQQLAHSAVVRSEHLESRARLAERQRVQGVQEEIIQKFAVGKLTTKDIMQSSLPAVGEGSKEHFLNALRARSKENSEQPFRTSPDTYRDLYRRITLPDGDKEKVVDAGPVNEAFLNGKLKPADRDNLLAAVAHDRTPEGNSLLKDVQTVKTAAHRMFMGHTMASIQPDLYGEASYRFGVELERKVEQFRKDGKDPRALLQPGNPDYVLAPGRVNSYMPNARAVVAAEASKAGAPAAVTRIANDDEFNKLPKGAKYQGPDGVIRSKP